MTSESKPTPQFPLPGTMTTKEALLIVASQRGWSDAELESDIATLTTKHRLRTIADCRSLAKESWKEIQDIPLIVRDNLRRLSWAEVAGVGPEGQVISKAEFRQMEKDFAAKVAEAQKQADEKGIDVELENPMKAGSLTSAGTFIGPPTLVRGRRPPPPPAAMPPPPPPPSLPPPPQPVAYYYPQPVAMMPPSVPAPLTGAALTAAVQAAASSSTPASPITEEATVVGSADDLSFAAKK